MCIKGTTIKFCTSGSQKHLVLPTVGYPTCSDKWRPDKWHLTVHCTLRTAWPSACTSQCQQHSTLRTLDGHRTLSGCMYRAQVMATRATNSPNSNFYDSLGSARLDNASDVYDCATRAVYVDLHVVTFKVYCMRSNRSPSRIEGRPFTVNKNRIPISNSAPGTLNRAGILYVRTVCRWTRSRSILVLCQYSYLNLHMT